MWLQDDSAIPHICLTAKTTPHLPCPRFITPYTPRERLRERARESVHVQWAASHSDTPTHTHTHSNQTHKSCWLRNTCTSHRQTGCGGVRSLLYFPFPSIRSPLLSFVFLRGMQNKLRSLIEHCLFAYAVCIVLVHDSLKELCTIASLCHCNQCTWVGYRLNLIDSDSFRFQCD